MAATRRIGEVFVERGFVSAEELEAALAVQRETGQRVGEILVAQGKLSRLDLASALSEQWDVSGHLAPGPAPALPVDEKPLVIDAAVTETRLSELEAVARKLQSDETGALLLRLESQIATLGERQTTDVRERKEGHERLREELVRYRDEIAMRDASMTEAVRAADASARNAAEHSRRLEEGIHGQMEQVRAQLAQLRLQVEALASQQASATRGGNGAASERKAKSKKKPKSG